MVAIPAEYLDLLQQKTTFANLATIMPDGTPQVTPVWFDYTDGKIPPFQVRSATVQHRRHGGVNGRGKGQGQGL